MNVNSIKPGSTTILVLNYLGMRKRSKKSWTTSKEVADFFPHYFNRKKRNASSDASTVLNRLSAAGFVETKDTALGKLYAITERGMIVPFEVRRRVENSPYYAKASNKDD